MTEQSTHRCRIALRSPKRALVALLGGAFLIMNPGEGWAIPAFARKHNVACSSCHSAFPYLNATGRAFKESGYRMPGEDGKVDPDAQNNRKVSEGLSFDKDFPVTGRILSYPVDKVKDKDAKLRPIHELEVIAAGNVARTVSFFAEIEGEDEDDFGMAGAAAFGFHPDRAANVVAGFGPVFSTDPYNTLADGGRRLTISHKTVLDLGSATRSRLRKDTPFINFYGRADRVYYGLGLSAGNSNPEGENPRDVSFRLAVDATSGVSIGGVGLVGTHTIEGEDVDIRRFGFDWSVDAGKFHLLGLFLSARDELGSKKETNKAFYTEALYTAESKGRKVFVPLVRLDWYEKADGSRSWTDLTGSVSTYLFENVRIGVEVSGNLDVPEGIKKTHRMSVLADLAL